jgi:hypothetical protein
MTPSEQGNPTLHVSEEVPTGRNREQSQSEQMTLSEFGSKPTASD